MAKIICLLNSIFLKTVVANLKYYFSYSVYVYLELLDLEFHGCLFFLYFFKK